MDKPQTPDHTPTPESDYVLVAFEQFHAAHFYEHFAAQPLYRRELAELAFAAGFAAARSTPADAETLQGIVLWGDETFGPCAPERAVSRAGEEWKEMLGEEPGSVQHAIEAADVIICLLRIPGILDAINAKMAKNRAREWKLMGDGTGYHVRPDGSTSAPAIEGVLKFMRHDGLCGIVGGYGYCTCGMEEAKNALSSTLSGGR